METIISLLEFLFKMSFLELGKAITLFVSFRQTTSYPLHCQPRPMTNYFFTLPY